MGSAPSGPGVYLMKDAEGAVIYIGKAKNLRTRVRAYLGGKDTRPMIPFLVPKIGDVEFIVTASEKEALILENNLIKKHRPRYNVNLRDDKNYFSIRVDPRVPFPRLELVRRIARDGARYFGPYSSSVAVRETLNILHQVFPLRTCKDAVFKTRRRPCIEHEIGRCLAPCAGTVSPEAYRAVLDDVLLFLEGREKTLVAGLRERMKKAAGELRFEEAAALRNRIDAVNTTLERQRVVSMALRDLDVFGFFRSGDGLQACVIHVRGGRLLGRKTFPLLKTREETAELFESLLKQYYHAGVFIPREVILPVPVGDRGLIEEWLADKKGSAVKLIVPQRGERADLLRMAMSNAENAFAAQRDADIRQERVLELLRDALYLSEIPRRIECFDISNLGGHAAVGSMVSFLDGGPDRSRYRRFRIRTQETMDDYGMMREVLLRRYREAGQVPDLLIVDGGRGQLGVARAVLGELGLERVAVAGLAKESRMRTGTGTALIKKDEDRVYLPNRKNPLYLSRVPAALLLLQRIRDEAHRFAVSYHRRLREKEGMRSLLDDIPGIGEKRKKALLEHFKDVHRIGHATREELAAVPGIGEKAAGLIFAHFH